MRALLGRLLSLLLFLGLVAALPALAPPARAAEPTVAAADDDVLDRVLAIPGMRLVEERPVDGYRYLVLTYTQPVDHRDPSRGTFEQRFSLLHKGTDRPTVFYTSGYGLSTSPSRSEPTRLVDGNQVSLEYRFFTPSRPDPADWSKLDIWQAASDQHRLFAALRSVYDQRWLATGGSKGGMTATYYERFYPDDMDGVVAYVAPNDVVDKEDSAYDDFFATVGTPECRARLEGVQREALVRRDALEQRYAELAEAEGYTFDIMGSLDAAFESVVLDYMWAFWQYAGVDDCDTIPADAATATDEEIWASVDTYSGFSFYTDQGLRGYTPYYYQAGTELGAPTIHFPHIERGLIRYGYPQPRQLVPREIPMKARPAAMRDIDGYVRRSAERMLFVYGDQDPWGAERFRPGPSTTDSYVVTAPGANHGANVAGLVPAEQAFATAKIQQWAGVAPARTLRSTAVAAPLAAYDPELDAVDLRRERALRP